MTFPVKHREDEKDREDEEDREDKKDREEEKKDRVKDSKTELKTARPS